MRHILLICAASLLLTACTNLIFQPTRYLWPSAEKFGFEKNDFRVPVQDGVLLHGWHLPVKSTPRGSILFLHGNGQNISNHAAAVYWLPHFGYEVYLVDYRGYGWSTGKVDLSGAMLDIEAALAYVTGKLGQGKKLIVMGHSLGASMTIYALSRSQYKTKIKGLLALSAFGDYRQVTRDMLAGHWLSWPLQWPLSLTIDNHYRPLDYIGGISPIPVSLLHGKNDNIVPLKHLWELYGAARQPKSMAVLMGKHNDIFDWPENRATILKYLSVLD